MAWDLLEMVFQNLPALNKYTRVLIFHRYDSDPLNQLALFVFGAMWIVYTVFLVQTHQYVYVRNQVAVQRLQHHDQEKIVRDDNYYLLRGLENRLHTSGVLWLYPEFATHNHYLWSGYIVLSCAFILYEISVECAQEYPHPQWSSKSCQRMGPMYGIRWLCS
jgi:hypothetical protein